MGLFDKFRKQSDEPAATSPIPPPSLPTLCYGIAYFILPHYVFNDCQEIVRMWVDSPNSVGPFFYFMVCASQKIEPAKDAPRLLTHHGQLDETWDYYILEYPTPPPVDLNAKDGVLAPYFSAILRHRETKAVEYYTLGQALVGGDTMLRSVTPSVNADLGPGPEPRLELFIACLRNRR